MDKAHPVAANRAAGSAYISADEWHDRLAREPLPQRPFGGLARVRHFVGTNPEVEQPELSDDIVCFHLGGAKRVHRNHAGRAAYHDVPLGSFTLMPRMEHNRWRTEGPVDFVHIALSQDFLSKIAIEEFDRDPADAIFENAVGFRDSALAALASEITAAADDPSGGGQLYAESLLVAFTVVLLRTRSRLGSPDLREPSLASGGLPAWRLKRVTEHIEERLHEEILLATLADTAGLSRAQFFRAFRQSTGTSPARYLRRQRVARAKLLISETELNSNAIARATGFDHRRALFAAFRSETGINFSEYRRLR